MHTIFGDLDYVRGYLRMGHLEMKLNDKDFEKFKSLSLKEQKEWLRDPQKQMILALTILVVLLK